MLRIEKEWFTDEKGRKVLLRGVNLGGSSKVPKRPNGATHIKTDFIDRDMSFVGRPFPLKEAPEHFRRIRHWGFNSLRFVVTWEAIEHENPKCYDKEYLDYVEEVLKVAEEYRFYTFIDPHQDVWSRASGGDGAPIWTFEKVGLDQTQFDASEAAFVMQHRFDPNDATAYPDMAWMQNYARFVPATMFTLFFGGKDFAPSCRIDGVNVQDFLQQHFINAMKQVANRVKDNAFVIGFEPMNEPSSGWIGKLVDGSDMPRARKLFHVFSPFEAMIVTAGIPRVIPYNAIKRFGIKEIRRDLLNPQGISCWLEGFEDIWQREGVWGFDETGEPIILRNDHFSVINERRVDFTQDYYAVFVKQYAAGIREVIPESMIFVGVPHEVIMTKVDFTSDLPTNIVNSCHWYDELTVGRKRHISFASYDTRTNKIVIGTGNIQKMFTRQIGAIKAASKKGLETIPTVIGEFGLCYDLDKGKAFQQWRKKGEKAWKPHVKALSMYYHALDANLLHSMHWNYTADNDNTWGDQWNLEDFSIFSRDQQTDPEDINSGGRAIKGFCRPHFVHVTGTPLKMEFSLKHRVFRFEFDADPSIDALTTIYVPTIQYPEGFVVELSEGKLKTTEDPQLVAFRVYENGIHTVVIKSRA